MLTYDDFDIKINRTVLNNGIPVLLFYKKGMPIHTEIKFASGSRYDPPEKEGLAHFVEHMIVAGSEKFPSKDKLAVYIEQLGGIFGASTSLDAISLHVEIASAEDVKESVLLFDEMILHSLLVDKTIENERKAILEEINEKIANPSKYIWELYSELFFQNTDVGKSSLGSKESVNSITKQNLYDYYNNMFVSGRVVIVACGDIDFEKFKKILQDMLPLKKSDKFIIPKPLPLNREKKKLIQHYPKQDQVQLIIGFRTTERKNSDSIPLDILSTIFGGGRAAVLNRRLRYEKGLVYGVSTSSHTFSNGGAWSVKTSTSKNTLQEVINIITDEFEKIYLGKISQDELAFAKNKLIKSSRRIMQTSASWVNTHSYNELIGNKIQLFDYLNIVNETTLEDLAKVGKKYFEKNKWYLAMCGDITENDVIVNY